uniref:GG20957 n=1 Tax=Drosophila erecta TaxID=7220 RepID=B3P3Q9_DROER
MHQQQHQRTNLRQRAAAVAASKARRQRQHLQPESTDSPQYGTDCIRLWPGCGPSTADRAIGNSPTCNNTSSSHISRISGNTRSSSISSISGCSCNFGRQRALIMLSVLVVVMALMSNGAYAAQRDSYNSKDMSSSNNALPNEGVGGSAAGAGEPAAPGPTGVAGSGSGNNSSGNNKNGHPAAGSSAASESDALTTDASRRSSGSPTTITGIPSSSLHKASSANSANSASSNIFSSQLASGFHRNSIDLEEARNAGPYFDKAFSKNVTALLGKTAYLNCRVKNLGNKTMLLQVSWVRHRDIHLLTVGRYTYTSDQRFRAIHQPQTEDWMLQIKYPQHRDSGIYECQVSTTPHMSHYIHLNVVEPSTEIIGAPDLYIESGSTINLTCIIQNSPEPPAYIFWNHNNAIINYDSPRGGVSVVTNKGDTTTSFLLIKSARPSDSGHYQCNPSNAKPKSVTVHVLNGVSHSVSRGVPSSNAARGTSASSPLAHSLSVCVPVCVLLQLGACRWIAALLGAALATPPPVRPARRTTGKRPGSAGCAPLGCDMRHFLASVLRWRWRWCWRWHWKGTQQRHPWHYVKPQSRREAATCRQPFEADIR